MKYSILISGMLLSFIFSATTIFAQRYAESPTTHTEPTQEEGATIRPVSTTEPTTRDREEEARRREEAARREAERLEEAQRIQETQVRDIREDPRGTPPPEQTRTQEAETRQLEAQQRALTARLRNIHTMITRSIRLLESSVARLARLEDRIEARIEIVKERDWDTTQAETYLREARGSRDEAEETIAAARERLSSLTVDELTPTTVSDIQRIVRSTAGPIRQAHAALVNAIAALRASMPEERPE